MDKVIVTIFLLIAGIVCSLAVFNAVYPAINRSSSAISTMSANVDDRIKSQVEVIQTGSQDTNVHVWIKNVGTTQVKSIEKCDVFLGQSGATQRVPYGSGEGYWDYVIEGNDTEWVSTATIKITIYLSASPSGTYFVKIVLPNGISDEHQFSL